jgi:hypothetical protein
MNRGGQPIFRPAGPFFTLPPMLADVKIKTLRIKPQRIKVLQPREK